MSGVEVHDTTVDAPHGTVPVRRYAPVRAALIPPAPTPPAPTRLVWLHGGAFVSGGLDQRESHEVALALAHRGIPVTTVGYPLVSRAALLHTRARGHRHPVPVEAVLAVARSEAAAGPIALGGASAGAALAGAGALRLAREGTPPRAAVLAYGILHPRLPPVSADLRARLRGPRRVLNSPRWIRLMTLTYAGRDGLRDPLAFPGGHDLAGFPPALVLDADRDWLRASSERFADELRAAGTPVERHVLSGSRHGFLHRPADPAFAEGIRVVAEWMQRH